MRIAIVTARILLGLLFIVAGAANCFAAPPPEPGFAGALDDVMFKSHWIVFLGVAQMGIGALLLINRYVPVALIMLAAFVYNSFGFHLTMAISSVWAPIVVTGLGLLVAWEYRGLFAPVFSAKPVREDRSGTDVHSVRAA